MNEKSLTVLEQYDLKINGTYRIKGNYGCDTDSGRYILQEYNNSNEKMAAMKVLYNHLEKNGFTTDYVVPNKDGNFVSVSEDGYTYILKRWFHAEECNVGNESHLLAGAKNLGRFHCCLENNRELLEEYRAFHPGKNMQDVFERHNKEIITIRNYIKKRKNKNYFEMSLHNIIEQYDLQAQEAANKLKKSDYAQKYAGAVESKTLNHGYYNYHNILFDREKVIMINMLKVNYAPQIQDLYDWLRKAMEKNDWNVELGKKIIEAYDGCRSITDSEYNILKIMLSYPEKFWKIINYYYNSNKAWYSEKNEDKLIKFSKQENLRWNFIKNL